MSHSVLPLGGRTTNGPSPIAGPLLRFMPDGARPDAVRQFVASLPSTASLQELALAASLLTEQKDRNALRAFVLFLRTLLTQGRLADVVAVVRADGDIETHLMEAVISDLYTEPSPPAAIEKSTDESQTRSAHVQHGERGEDPDMSHLINFTKLADVSRLSSENMRKLYLALLYHLGLPHPASRLAARDALVTIFANNEHKHDTDDSLVWLLIKRLLGPSTDKSSPNLGYSLWLWWASSKPQSLALWLDQDYWSALESGLRRGDGERRKQCLGILRQSVAVAASDDSLHFHICSSHHSVPLSAASIQSQYDRYLAVFETCILGRYLNQVMACEGDLDVWSTTQPVVQSRWICCLLSAALDPKVQESNRKFIGGWLMRTRYQPQDFDEFHNLLQSTVIPWLVQGHLFTNSLSRADGTQRCGHGDRLAKYIEDILRLNAHQPGHVSRLVDLVMETFIGRKAARFAYAAVYLINGLAQGLAHAKDFSFSASQFDTLVQMLSANHLPELAREYVYLCSLQLAHRYAAQSSPELVEIERQWRELQASPADQERTPLAARFSRPSRRDELDKQARQKIAELSRACVSRAKAGHELDALLRDLREDIEYLEHPKRLLMQFTGLLFEPALIEAALAHRDLGQRVADNIRDLQAMSAHRIYLVSPLVVGLSGAALRFADFGRLVSTRDFILEFCENLPEPSLDMQLEDATSALLNTTISPAFAQLDYHYYLGDRPSVGLAALLDLLTRLHDSNRDVFQDVFNAILRRWSGQKNPPPTVSPWKSALQLQVLILCGERIIPHTSRTEACRILKDLDHLLAIEPLPRYRYLLSWLMARAYLQHDDLKTDILTELGTEDHHSNPKYLASLMKIAVMLAKAPDATEDYASRLASACIPLAASSKVVIRHEAQWQIPLLLNHALAKDWTTVSQNAGLQALNQYIRTLQRFGDPPLERLLDRFDPVADHTLANLSEGLWYGLDDFETPICRRDDFIQVEAALAKTIDQIPPRTTPLGPTIVRRPSTVAEEKAVPTPPVQDLALAPGKNNESRALQTKGTAYLATYPSPQTRRRDIVVVASLVDNPYNLGGISRASEIFGAAEMHLQNQNVTSNRDFQGVAVSSHLHLPILQLSASAVPVFLAGKRAQGYVIVGIEQTDRSVILGSSGCVLPERIVLVIGAEKEGIPALVLSECDVLVEIPQQGVTRSLNVQTAVSIVLFEYARQHGEVKA